MHDRRNLRPMSALILFFQSDASSWASIYVTTCYCVPAGISRTPSLLSASTSAKRAETYWSQPSRGGKRSKSSWAASLSTAPAAPPQVSWMKAPSTLIFSVPSDGAVQISCAGLPWSEARPPFWYCKQWDEFPYMHREMLYSIHWTT